IRHDEVAEEYTPVGVRVSPHAALACGGKCCQCGDEAAVVVEEFLRLIAPHPALEELEMLGMFSGLGALHLMATERPFDRLAIDDLRPGPAFGRLQNEHWPAGAGRDTPGPGIGLDLLDLGDDLVESRRHTLVHGLWLMPLDNIGGISVATEELFQFLAADPG